MPGFIFQTPERDLLPRHLWSPSYISSPSFLADYAYLHSQQLEIQFELSKNHYIPFHRIEREAKEAVENPDDSERCDLLRVWWENGVQIREMEKVAEKLGIALRKCGEERK